MCVCALSPSYFAAFACSCSCAAHTPFRVFSQRVWQRQEDPCIVSCAVVRVLWLPGEAKRCVRYGASTGAAGRLSSAGDCLHMAPPASVVDLLCSSAVDPSRLRLCQRAQAEVWEAEAAAAAEEAGLLAHTQSNLRDALQVGGAEQPALHDSLCCCFVCLSELCALAPQLELSARPLLRRRSRC